MESRAWSLGASRTATFMLSAFKVNSRFPDEDHVAGWLSTEPRTLNNPLSKREPLADLWEPVGAYFKPADAPSTDIAWFETSLALSDRDGDPVVREILARSGEWLPLGGAAEGLSIFHPLHVVEVDLERSQRLPHDDGKGEIERYAFDEESIVPDQVSWVRGLGLVWFESSYSRGLRECVVERDLTGIGFIKCWDASGDFRFNTKWWIELIVGKDIWS